MSLKLIHIYYADGEHADLEVADLSWSDAGDLLIAKGAHGEDYFINIAWCALITITPAVSSLTLIKKEKKVEPS